MTCPGGRWLRPLLLEAREVAWRWVERHAQHAVERAAALVLHNRNRVFKMAVRDETRNVPLVEPVRTGTAQLISHRTLLAPQKPLTEYLTKKIMHDIEEDSTGWFQRRGFAGSFIPVVRSILDLITPIHLRLHLYLYLYLHI